jgi:hypothetical protein
MCVTEKASSGSYAYHVDRQEIAVEFVPFIQLGIESCIPLGLPLREHEKPVVSGSSLRVESYE